ncbi:MAG: pantoate--beta-alanine ligase, partial [Sciscionella sp.]
GVLTVVAKLLHIVGPDYAFFGEKDYQQLVLLERMARELDFPTRIIGVPTVREPDGLARSTRNAYLTDDQRAAACSLSAALTAGAAVSAGGVAAVLAAAHEVLAAADGVALDYLELRAPDLGPAPETGTARLLVAAMVGETRLIDTVAVLRGAPVEES